MKLENREFLKSEAGRKWLIEEVVEVVPTENNWQAFRTPYDLCEYMASKTTLEGKIILVLFNVEFLEVLIHKLGVSSTNITFLADCRIESELAAKVYKVNNTIVNNIDDIEKELKKVKTFDLCFSNPPYGTGGTNLDLKILNTILSQCKEIVFIHPSNWIINNKLVQGPWNWIGKLKDRLEKNIVSIEIFDGNKILNIQKYTPCSITHIKKDYDKLINVKYFDESEYLCKSINDITVFSEKWFSIVLPFKNRIMEEILKTGNIWDNRVLDIKRCNANKFHCQFSGMRPADAEKTGKYMHYRLLNDGQNYIVDDIKNLKNGQIIYEFDTKVEVENFLNYIQTNFACFCHAILKSNHHVDRNELSIVPMMNFNEEWSDQKLYNFFNISEETVNYIIDFFKQFD